MQVGYALYEDAGQYDAFGLDVRMPTLVFQGTRDTVVDEESREFLGLPAEP